MLRENECGRALSVHTEPIDLANQYVFGQLLSAVNTERSRYTTLCDDIDRILAVYEEKFPDITKRIHEIKLEIRLITKGIPTTEPLDAVSSHSMFLSDPNFNAQQHEAISVMLKDAYRKAAMVTHPDREGGNKDLFDQVNRAYKDRDLSHLIYLYLSVSAFRNLYWRQSEEGIYFVSNELDRYTTLFTQLRASEVFKVARFHIIGAPWKAETQMHSVLLQHLEKYSNELTYLRNKHHGNSEQETGSEDWQDQPLCQSNTDQQGQEGSAGSSSESEKEAG